MARSRDRSLTGRRADLTLLAATMGGLAAGIIARLAGQEPLADALWAAATVVGLVASAWWVVAAARHRRLGVDVLALLALVGTLLVGEYVAGALIAVMLATGRTLEAHAAARAQRELRVLAERAPRSAHRYRAGELEDVDVAVIHPGDLVLVRPGEVVPVDGLVAGRSAILDESALTGEPLPVEHEPGDPVRSGTVNAGDGFDLRSTTTAEDSTYAGIVRLVSQAEADTAPFVRMADRYAVAFLAVSLVIAGVAWLTSGDPVRAVAVLVVATPCPLILAAPVALVSGLSRAAHRGVILKGGAVLERLAQSEVLLLDKTGTLTEGRPTVAEVVTADGVDRDDLLRLTASVDQVSPHVLAAAIVRAARARDLPLTLPTEVQEEAGRGVTGTVAGHRVSAGKAGWLRPDPAEPWVRSVRRRADLDGALTVFVSIDDVASGALVLDDPVRPDAARTLRQLRHDGIQRIIMVTGDRADVAQTVGAVIGVDEVLAERSPAEKVEAVRIAERSGRTVMVGDGINDAPALALADVGVAIGARGSTASSEAADVVLTVDRLDRLGEAMAIARRARRIALQSVLVGIGLSLVAMLAAAFGLLPPALGALLQEAIDVAVILNALRVLRTPVGTHRLTPADEALARQFTAEHRMLRPDLDRLRRVADDLDRRPTDQAIAAVRLVHQFLAEDVLPHEEAEDATLYPVFARVLGGHDPTGTMSRAHVEIGHLIRRLGRLLDEVATPPSDEDLLELRRVLYGLHAILELHFAQEDENYLSLVEVDADQARALATG